MSDMGSVAQVSFIGFLAASSSLAGAALGLYVPVQKRLLACILAFAAGLLIAALAIDLAYGGAVALHKQGFDPVSSWALDAGGFAVGALVYYLTSLYLEQRGAAVRLPARFVDYALARKEKDTKPLIGLLARCDLLRHLPPGDIESVLPMIRSRTLGSDEILFRAGDPGDALYIVAHGSVDVLADNPDDLTDLGQTISRLKDGDAFGEMALLSGQPRTASIRAAEDTELLEIQKADFERLIAADPQLATAVRKLSHERAITNLKTGGTDPHRWAEVAASSLGGLSHGEADKLLKETGRGAALAITLGSILDTIPGCIVVGATFTDLSHFSLTLVAGIFLSGVAEGAASGVMLSQAGFTRKRILSLWTIVAFAGMVTAGMGNVLLGGGPSVFVVLNQGVAGGATLAVVAHAMIPEAIHDGRSLVVLPIVAGFLCALYLSITSNFI